MKNAFIAITYNKSTNEYILDINSKILPKTIIEFDTNKINLLVKAKNFVTQNKEIFDEIFLSSSLVNRITYDDWDFICGKEPTGDGPMPTAIRQSM